MTVVLGGRGLLSLMSKGGAQSSTCPPGYRPLVPKAVGNPDWHVVLTNKHAGCPKFCSDPQSLSLQGACSQFYEGILALPLNVAKCLTTGSPRRLGVLT